MDEGRHARSASRTRSPVAGLTLLALGAIAAGLFYYELVVSVWDAEEFSTLGRLLMLGLPLVPVLIASTRRSLPHLITGIAVSFVITPIVILLAVWYSFNISGGV